LSLAAFGGFRSYNFIDSQAASAFAILQRAGKGSLPTLWFEDRGNTPLKFTELCGIFVFLGEAVAVGLLVLLELFLT
jgi:hypothetical protein